MVFDRALFYDSTKALISRSDSIESGIIQSSIIPSNTTYMRATFRKAVMADITPSDMANAQIEVGTTATTYEPYHTPITYPISLGSNKFYKIGDYADELLYDVDEDRVYKNEKIYEVVLNGTETWAKSNNAFYLGDTAFNELNLPLYLESTGIICISDKYVAMANVQSSANVQNFKCCFFQNNTTKRLYFGDDRFDSGVAFKNWVVNNNITLDYILATPTPIEITDTTLINQVKALYNAHYNTGTTILESNVDLPMIIKVRALKGE